MRGKRTDKGGCQVLHRLRQDNRGVQLQDQSLVTFPQLSACDCVTAESREPAIRMAPAPASDGSLRQTTQEIPSYA